MHVCIHAYVHTWGWKKCQPERWKRIRSLKGEICAVYIERKHNEVNVISQELALHGCVCKYGMLLFEAVYASHTHKHIHPCTHTRVRASSAKIADISTIHEAFTWKTWLPEFELSDSIELRGGMRLAVLKRNWQKVNLLPTSFQNCKFHPSSWFNRIQKLELGQPCFPRKSRESSICRRC